MTRKILLLASSIVALASVAACGGGGNKTAKIDSFTANPSIVPTLGGEVTLVWDVRNADEIVILPDVGVVTGTSLTLTVTETTEFKLVAKRNGTSKRKSATVTVTEPNMVVGTVRSMANNVVMPDTVVIILGHDPVVTDANGMFAVPDVATPYEVLLLSPEDGFSVLFDGLTRFDPVLDFPLGPAFAPDPRSASVSGVVTGVVAGTTTQVTVDTDVILGEFFFGDNADNTTGLYDVAYNWNGPASAPATVRALRYGNGSPITSYLYGTAETTLVDGVATGGVNLTLTSAGTASTRFTYTNFDDFSPSEVFPAMLLGAPTGTAADDGFILPENAVSLATNDDLVLTTPDFQDAFGILSLAYEDSFNGVGVDIQTVPVGTESSTVTLLSPPRLLVPVNEGSITPESSFVVNAQPDSAKMFFFGFNGPSTNHSLIVVTTESTVTLPDLQDIGVPFDETVDVFWTVMEIAPRTTLDEIAGPGGILGSNPSFIGMSAQQTAYFQAAQ